MHFNIVLINKKIYDNLFENKSAIEERFGEKIQWSRLNDKIASRIYVTIEDISLANENDWERMSIFHSDNCSKLKDAISDYLDKAIASSK